MYLIFGLIKLHLCFSSIADFEQVHKDRLPWAFVFLKKFGKLLKGGTDFVQTPEEAFALIALSASVSASTSTSPASIKIVLNGQ